MPLSRCTEMCAVRGKTLRHISYLHVASCLYELETIGDWNDVKSCVRPKVFVNSLHTNLIGRFYCHVAASAENVGLNQTLSLI